MKRLFRLFLLAWSLATALACVREEADVIGRKTFDSFTATIEEGESTKVHLESSGVVTWNVGDRIGVFSDTDDILYFTRGEDGIFHTWEGESISGNQFYAFAGNVWYPGGDDRMHLSASLDPKNPGAMPMVARSQGNTLSFKHTGGIIHFRITTTSPVALKSMVIYSNNGELIGGECSLDMEEEVPVLHGSVSFSWLYPSDPIQISPDEPYDVYFVLAPQTLTQGFSLQLEYGDDRLILSTEKEIHVGRATMTSFTIADLNTLIEEQQEAPVRERNALVKFYEAMGGDNWTDKTNWCSDAPLGQWYGVVEQNGVVTGLSLAYNNLCGRLPDELAGLKNLKSLNLEGNDISLENSDIIYSLENLTWLNIGSWSSFGRIAVNEKLARLKKLRDLQIVGGVGFVPEGLMELANLESINLIYFQNTEALPSGWGQLKKLTDLWIVGYNSPEDGGPVPTDICDCSSLTSLCLSGLNLTGTIPSSIGNLTNLYYLSMSGNLLSGTLPVELTNLTGLTSLYLENNNLSGKVPSEFADWYPWSVFWGHIIEGNNLDISEAVPPVPDFDVELLDGSRYTDEMLRENQLTILFQWGPNCPYSPQVIPSLKAVYQKYHGEGLEIISWANDYYENCTGFLETYQMPWPTFLSSFENCIGSQLFPYNLTPLLTFFDGSGKLVNYIMGSASSGSITEFVDKWYGVEEYESTDYSSDGTVHTLQTATVGKGIDMVLMGDAFSDRLIANGTYVAVMQRAADAFFSEEPYKSFRNCFNVYYVDVVSKNEIYTGETALETYYGDQTTVGGNHEKVRSYAAKALSSSQMDEALIIVMMNRDYYAGTCYMSFMEDGDYGRGSSIAYFPTSSDNATFAGLVSHEAGGHGFAKLDDEYAYDGTIPEETVAYKHSWETYGCWKNVDFTSNPAAVKWSAFISDERYASQGIGVYEGACTYAFGAFRPTENSIMRYNTDGFNAPSRYAIWYRINKLAFGADWTGTYEDFVTWDLAHRSTSAQVPRARVNSVERRLPPLHPPVIVDKDWREVVQAH